MTEKPTPDPKSMLPLRPLAFSILLVLKKENLHGYAIMKRVNADMGRPKLLGPGTLYRNLKELREMDLVEHVDPPRADRSSDERRAYYGLTSFGKQVARAEAERVARLLREAQWGGLLSKARSK